MKSEINEKESELDNVRTERESAAMELESAKSEREELMRKAAEYEEQLAQQHARTQEIEISRELEVSLISNQRVEDEDEVSCRPQIGNSFQGVTRYR